MSTGDPDRTILCVCCWFSSLTKLVLTRSVRVGSPNSKVSFGGALRLGQKVGLEVGFSSGAKEENRLLDLFDLFQEFPRNLVLSCFGLLDEKIKIIDKHPALRLYM